MQQASQTYLRPLRSVFRAVTFIYNKMHWFTDKEAWALFRVFAVGEAVGWTMLISSIIYRSFDLPAYISVVGFAGRIHGVLFLLYFMFVILTARSMKWGFWRVVCALIAGMPPYTSLVFEQYMARHRRKHPIHVAPPAGAED